MAVKCSKVWSCQVLVWRQGVFIAHYKLLKWKVIRGSVPQMCGSSWLSFAALFILLLGALSSKAWSTFISLFQLLWYFIYSSVPFILFPCLCPHGPQRSTVLFGLLTGIMDHQLNHHHTVLLARKLFLSCFICSFLSLGKSLCCCSCCVGAYMQEIKLSQKC